MKKFRKLCTLLVITFVMMTICPDSIAFATNQQTVTAATLKISKKKVTLTKWQKITLSIRGTKKKVTWSSSNKNVAAVNGNGTVTANKKGSTIITAKIGFKKYKCTVTVKNPKKYGKAKLRVSSPDLKYSRLSFGAGPFDGNTMSRIYIDNKLASSIKPDWSYSNWYWDGGPGIKLNKNQLKKGVHTIELVRFERTTKKFKILDYKKSQYKVK